MCKYNPLLHALRIAFPAICREEKELRYWHTRIHQRKIVVATTYGAWNEFTSTGQHNTEKIATSIIEAPAQ